MHHRSFLPLAALALALLLPLRLAATTVMPPQFDELVAQSDYVVHGVVRAVTAEKQTSQGRNLIVTKVTIEVQEAVVGAPPTTVVLEMLGGTVGNERLVVHGTPQFQVGDEDILFVHGNGTLFSPLVAVMYGRYPVVHLASSAQAYVARSNGEPLYSAQDVATPMGEGTIHAKDAQPLTKDKFISAIRRSFQNARNQHQNQ